LQHAQHRSDIVSKMYEGSPALTERIQQITQMMIAKTETRLLRQKKRTK